MLCFQVCGFLLELDMANQQAEDYKLLGQHIKDDLIVGKIQKALSESQMHV